ncbi:UPF0182 family protein [Acetivibrio sp. MSJd-27]|uniref:UPF0182 family membrane protein n=1 Tax=Acetivibrio sp. MSJd-27 TaxID=2841523 RepID=UPI001C104BBC|nr:UPF0182 family protein [Acetivibrio sp. MSJd-27]MBU5449875.1 UPF0182 family protein [Acetivibrio sp. MSJd-27]
MSKIAKRLLIIFLAAIILIGLLVAVNIYFTYIQYKEIGENYTQVYLTNLQAKLIAQAVSFLFVFLIFLVSLLFVRKNLLKLDDTFGFLRSNLLIFIFTFLLSLIASSIIQSTVYERLLQFLNPTMMSQGDPIFNKDIGYYLFQRPFLISLCDSCFALMIFITVAVLIAYIILYAKLGLLNISEIFKVRGIVIHNVVNIAVLILIKAISYTFKAESILYSESGAVYGAGYTDITVWMNYYRIIPFLLLTIVLLTMIFLYRGKYKWSIGTILVYPVTYLAFFVFSLGLQTFYVKPEEVNREAPYIANTINLTRQAYGLDNIEQKEFNIQYNLTANDLEANKTTLSNIRIIDYPSTLKAVNQLQGIRNYYSFNDIDIVKYDIEGKPAAIALAPREFNKEKLDTTTTNFINERLRFTHGFGAVGIPVNQVTKEGQPAFFIKDIPPQSTQGFPEITQPRVYFGESTNDYVVVNSGYKELDYSQGQEDAEFSYDGQAGISMNLFNKVLFSVYNTDFQMLISSFIDENSKILINRNVLERVSKVAPFLEVDNDPYMVINEEGKLKWVVNCYTTSSEFPYSQPVSFNGRPINYIRDSVKAVVDAYDGTVDFYITDPNDPIVQTYKKIYPRFFNENPLPADIASHLQYPEKMFKVQSTVFKKYHTTNTDTFYNRTDVWEYCKEKVQGEAKPVEPYYSLMPLFGEKEELILMIPYTLSNKDNLVAWLAVSCDAQNYGKMALYTFPKGENVYGTMQIANRIDSDPNISKEMTLWSQGGSSVTRGNMLVVPVKNSLLYVQPVYISSSNDSSIPELKRVIVAYGDKIVMEATLEDCLMKLFNYKLESDLQGEASTAPSVVEPPESGQENPTVTPAVVPNESEQKVVELYDRMKAALSKSDWTEFGRSMEELEKEINKLRK